MENEENRESTSSLNGAGMEEAGQTENKPAWMSDPLVREIPKQKMRFLEELFAKGTASGRGKSQKELMASLMPMMKRARQEGLSFTPMEMNAAIAAIRKHSSEKELQQIDKILEKSRQNRAGE